MCPAPWNDEPLPAHLLPSHETDSLEVDSSQTYSPKPRTHPVSHPTVDAPICPECQALENTFFDPTCKACRKKLQSREADIAHVFSVLRQWVPQVQQQIEFLVDECLRRGSHPDDRDSLTDMTLLMYACKAGANGVGDQHAAANVSKSLIALGSDVSLRCKWTNMSTLHYAAYFDVGPVLTTLLRTTKGTDVDTTCTEYENGTSLHIAAANLSVEAAGILLSFGADKDLQDDLARMPIDCIPELEDFDLIPDAAEIIVKMKKLLSNSQSIEDEPSAKQEFYTGNSKAISGRTALKALGLKVGDRVVVNGSKLGTLRFCGSTDFAPGVWAGIEYEEEDGKNDGSVKGVMYFKCKMNHGVFVMANKVTKAGKNYRDAESLKPVSRPTIVNKGKVDISHVSSRLTDCLAVIEEKQEVRVGDRVRVTDLVQVASSNQLLAQSHASGVGHYARGRSECDGTVRFVGSVDFVDDDKNKWYGVELDHPAGRHDGTVQGVRYFAAADNAGVFVTEAKIKKIPSESYGSNNNGFSGRKHAAASRESLPPGGLLLAEDEAGSFSGNFHNLVDVDPVRAAAAENNGNGRTSLSMRHRVAKSSSFAASDLKSSGPAPPARSVSRMSTTSRMTTAGGRMGGGDVEDGWQSVSAVHFNKFKKKVAKKYLDVGTSVICIHNKEMGVVRYVGRVDFSPGIWVGLELRSPAGKHDGFVEGKRYFTSKPSHGVLLRPKKISVHGINGEKLLKPEHEYPF